MRDEMNYPVWKVPRLGDEDLARITRRGADRASARHVRRRRLVQGAVVVAVAGIATVFGFWRTTTFEHRLASAREMVVKEIACNQEYLRAAMYEPHDTVTKEIPYERAIHD